MGLIWFESLMLLHVPLDGGGEFTMLGDVAI